MLKMSDFFLRFEDSEIIYKFMRHILFYCIYCYHFPIIFVLDFYERYCYIDIPPVFGVISEGCYICDTEVLVKQRCLTLLNHREEAYRLYVKSILLSHCNIVSCDVSAVLKCV